MLYALFCHQFKTNCNEFRSDALSILLRISYLWHPVTSSLQIKQILKINFILAHPIEQYKSEMT